MYPAPFDYSSPNSLDEVFTLLAEHGDAAKLLAGGQSLLPLMKLRLAQPSHLIDLRRIDALSEIRVESARVTIGAMTTHARIASSPAIRALLPIVTDAASVIGDPQVRNRGTIGGSLAHADPAADLPAVMLATDAELVAASSNGTRSIPAQDFFVDILTSALNPGEVLSEIRVPIPQGRVGGAYAKHPHPASRFALVGVAAVLRLSDDGQTIREARVGVTGVTLKAMRAFGVEDALTGQPATVEALQHAASGLALDGDIRQDLQGTAEFKLNLTRVYAERALSRALERATAA